MRAVEVVEDDTGAIVLLLDLVLNAVDVVDVATLQVDARFLSKTCAVANVAEIGYAFFRSFGRIHFLNAFGLETWHTDLFTGCTAARMATL